MEVAQLRGRARPDRRDAINRYAGVLRNELCSIVILSSMLNEGRARHRLQDSNEQSDLTR